MRCSLALPRLPRACYLIVLLSAACGGGDGGPTTPPPAVTVSVTPISATVDAGGSATFSATVANATNTGVTWTASGGTVAGNGTTATYTAPLSGGPFTVTATSVADPTLSASAIVTVRSITVSVSPATAAVPAGGTGRFTATVANTANTGVVWTASGGTIVGDATAAAVDWKAPVQAGSYTLTATSTADPSRTGVVTITVAPIAVVVTADSVVAAAGATRLLSARVTGAADTSVVWRASGGTIVGTGPKVSWVAPAVGGAYTITAKSVLDTTALGTASITVQSVTVAVSPTTRTLYRGEATSYTATVTGAALGRDSVTWRSTCGPVVSTGLTATLNAPVTPGACTVTAVSRLDTTKVATATLTVRATLIVTSVDDVSDGACTYAHCSLREAIAAANVAQNVDTILLGAANAVRSANSGRQSGRYMSASAAGDGTITLTSKLPEIVSPMVIMGPGASTFTLNAAGSVITPRRAFEIQGTIAVTISGISISGGYETRGGGILINDGADVVLDHVTVSGNTAANEHGGGVLVYGGSALRVEESLFENNVSNENSGYGGAIYADDHSTLQVHGGTFRENKANRGGAIGALTSAVTLTDVTIVNNQAVHSGGGIRVINGGTLTIVGGVLRNNKATFSTGGGLVAYATGDEAAQGLTLVMQNVRVENNTAAVQGGGMQLTRNVKATLTQVVITGNTLTDVSGSTFTAGGGIFGGESVTLTIDQSTVSNNRVLSAVLSYDHDDGGGGIMLYGIMDGTTTSLTIRNSTISGNESGVRGGGIYISVGMLNDAVNHGNQSGARVGDTYADLLPVSTIVNSTISGNSAPTAGGLLAAAITTLRNVTMTGNRSTLVGAGLRVDDYFATTVQNSLFADNKNSGIASNCSTGQGGVITSLGHNLSDDVNCPTFTGTGDRTNTAAGVSPTLENNGGPTFTHALLAGSAAIDGGDAAACTPTDQRGMTRIGICDIGAVEYTGGSSNMMMRQPPKSVKPTLKRGAPHRVPARLSLTTGDEADYARSGKSRR